MTAVSGGRPRFIGAFAVLPARLCRSRHAIKLAHPAVACLAGCSRFDGFGRGGRGRARRAGPRPAPDESFLYPERESRRSSNARLPLPLAMLRYAATVRMCHQGGRASRRRRAGNAACNWRKGKPSRRISRCLAPISALLITRTSSRTAVPLPSCSLPNTKIYRFSKSQTVLNLIFTLTKTLSPW